MALSLEDIMAPDRAKVDATTEEDIRRHAAEDGSELARPLSEFVLRLPGESGSGGRARKEELTLSVDSDAIGAWRSSGVGGRPRSAYLLAGHAPRPKRAYMA